MYCRRLEDLFKMNEVSNSTNGMTYNSPFISNNQKQFRLDIINCNLPEDTSHFTISDKKSPKLATYYFKHEDTDSSMEKSEHNYSLCEPDTENETKGNNRETNHHFEDIPNCFKDKKETEKKEEFSHMTPEIKVARRNINKPTHSNRGLPRPKSLSEDTIRVLVQKAEELVSTDKRHKLTKVNKWLKLEKPDDSCDASGEDDEKESQTSDDLDASTATLRGGDYSLTDLTVTSNGSRQWLGSISRFNDVVSTPGINSFSISESALHKMILSQKDLPTSYTTVSTNNVNSNNSTSSTVEEVLPLIVEKTSPIRKKKSKLKKRTLFVKSDTHLLSNSCQKIKSYLIKSGSFPGYSTMASNSNENDSKHETFTEQTFVPPGNSETSTTSGGDSEDDNKRRPLNFKYGGKTRYLTNEPLRTDKLGKNSINAEEQSSSLSEQAWDNYQENYLSEPYSESHDSDAARRLLNFGEDYRNFIDSQSDWSAFSDISPRMKRKSWPQRNDEGSNSEEESLKQIISDSKEHLNRAAQIYDQIKMGTYNHMVTQEIDDLISTCDRHINLLKHMSDSSDGLKMSYVDKAVTTGLLDQWRVLKIKSSSMDEFRKLHKQILELKSFITTQNFAQRKINISQHCGIEDIYNEIDSCNKLLETLLEHGSNLASLNALVHRYSLDNQDSEEFSGTTLKAEVSELYEMFDHARTCLTDELCQLKSLLPVWRTLESRLEQLQNDLKKDEKTIQVLNSCLTNGTFTVKTASTVREVAKLLSESTTSITQPIQDILMEGSFSDSGISDEGSEQEIGERQRRLAAIRRLVRQLEIGLPPDSKARLMMREKLSAAEEDLKSLQLHCRSLIARTSACSGSFVDKLRSVPEEEAALRVFKTAPGDPDSDPERNPNGKSWFRRFFKVSFTIQLILITFFCLSCLFEPSCCDYMNNYSWSLSPKLHYGARPPI
ncbi:uncharacterized protein LOC130893801 isoform X2 [Diorhabda carinulata]|uniref:uncharacterized protein LOC130893801 isoform X2 n=1 Tax=Diorhabda carinulata TaxID=1163345 RepID=UPI0025A1C42E|nr:uncharacterized protein LOC130893801 isoform X2 [Diorhabda carinulata]